jgi:hypothetical protein
MAEEADRSGERSETSEERPSERGLLSPSSLSSQWPTLDPAAYHGIAGRVVDSLGPHTEADPVALLLTFLTAFGNLIGTERGAFGPRAVVGGAVHATRLNVLLVGETARARKGTAQAEIYRLLDVAGADAWHLDRIMSGLASGEGLIAAVNDDDGDPINDKRLLVVESEFARVLAVAAREGNTLSAVIRQAWDSGDLRTMTRKDPLRATDAHISIIGHITTEELRRRLGDTEIANGFANRFLLGLVRRSKKLPKGGQLDPAALDSLAEQVRAAAWRANDLGVLHRSEEAEKLWAEAYDGFGDGEPGLVGALTARPEAQTLRLSVVYAALDGSKTIEPPHIRAALAVWEYCEASASSIFGSLLGDPVADRLLEAIHAAGGEGLDGAAQHAVFGRHVTATRLALARALLEAKGLIVTSSEETGGRPRLVSRAVTQ